jgi:hypothetical protein
VSSKPGNVQKAQASPPGRVGDVPGYGKQVPIVLAPVGKPGTAWPSDLKAPIGNGSSISSMPLFGGPPPAALTGGDPQAKLGLGNADPTVHGGG